MADHVGCQNMQLVLVIHRVMVGQLRGAFFAAAGSEAGSAFRACPELVCVWNMV